MRHIALLIVLLTTTLKAQNDLKFDKKFVQSEDKWVAFKADSVGSHNFGFIYIDAQAGLTFDYAGSFKINTDGKYILKKKEMEGMMKYRLEPNNVLVALIPESHYNELEITKFPDWLKFYKEGENTIERLFKWGYMYNGWGECAKALEFLEKAKTMDPNFKSLRVELAYSYNCLGQYEKAIEVLKTAMKSEPKDAYINKELLYAYVHNNQLDEAIALYNKIEKEVPDKTYNLENAYNILGEYFRRKDLKKFTEWMNKTQIDKDKRFAPYVAQMKKELKIE